MSGAARQSLLGLAAVVIGGTALAQEYPAKPIRWVVPFPPGGSVDGVARRIGPALAAKLGQQVVLDNRTGASGNIAAELVARAPGDGYTVMNHTVPFVVNTFLYARVPYDVLRDFAPISLLGSTPSMLTVHPSLPVRTVKELIALARAKPGALFYGSAGIGALRARTSEISLYCASTLTPTGRSRAAASSRAELSPHHAYGKSS
jgi:tripartite-type tricarboxylate transporter receptor subunit TctC